MTPLLHRLLFPFRLYTAAIGDLQAYPYFLAIRRHIIIFSLVVLYAVIALTATVDFTWRTLPAWQDKWQKTWEDFKQGWPDNLIITYHQGELQLEPDTPQIVPYPQSIDHSELPANLARIDTRENPSDEHDSLVFVTKDKLTTQSSLALSDLFGQSSWRVAKTDLPTFDQPVQDFAASLTTPLIIIFFAQKWLLTLIARLLGLLLYAWIGQTIFYLTGSKLRYGQAYTLGLAALLPAETLQTLLNILYHDNPLAIFWWAWMGIIILVAWFNRDRISA